MGHTRIRDDPGCDHDAPSLQRSAVTQTDYPFAGIPSHGVHIRSGLNGQLKCLGVAVQVVEEMIARRKEGSRRRERQARQGGQMFSGMENEAVVQVGPGVADRSATLENQVTNTGPRQFAR
jgi:hypothetical protein